MFTTSYCNFVCCVFFLCLSSHLRFFFVYFYGYFYGGLGGHCGVGGFGKDGKIHEYF